MFYYKMADYRPHFLSKNPHISQNKSDRAKQRKRFKENILQISKMQKKMGSIFSTFEYLAHFAIRAQALKTHHFDVISLYF